MDRLEELAEHKVNKRQEILRRRVLGQGELVVEDSLEKLKRGDLEEETLGFDLDGLAVEETDDPFELLGGVEFLEALEVREEGPEYVLVREALRTRISINYRMRFR